ncbi:MAG TPA: purine nucleoside permease [Terracidiphilus sp.]|nr:purine nucleoside permease [Terracidiphilus sp.]
MTTRMLRLCLFFAVSSAVAAAKPQPIPVKVVVVAMFEVGADTGDAPGELQYWVERDHLDSVYPLPAAYHAVRMNKEGEMAVLTGQGTAHAASTIMAVGLDPRFDFSHAYWIIAGIAGGCPDRVSLGSAAWARWVVDGDLGYEIDAREIPSDWTTGYLPLRKKQPYEQPTEALEGQFYALNAGLTQWAYNLTQDVSLDDSDQLKESRSHFEGTAAQRPSFVTLGDEISSSTYWHGKLFDAWAAQWVPYFTGGKGEFATTAMEDTGTLQSLQYLARAGRVDADRVLVLRTVSNYDRQPQGLTAAESLAKQRIGAYAAYRPALESAYRVGHTVVKELLTHWSSYENSIPTASAIQKK